ncbi:hypothetical protein JCM9279_006022 [Rhodotorula babjevae]
MHQRLDTDDSLLEADGLADFAARLRDSTSSRGGVGGPSRTVDGGWGEQGRRWNHGNEHDPPHSQPARYHASDLLPSSSIASPPPFAAPTRRDDLSDSTMRSRTSPADSSSFARPSPPRHESLGPPSPLARPLLKREPALELADVCQDTLRSSSSNHYPPPFSPVSTLPYPPPPPFVSPAYADPHAVAYPFDDYDDYHVDMRGDLGTSSWSARPDSVGKPGDAASEKDFAASPGPSVGEWHAPGGAYLHGVGFDDSHAHGAAQPPKKSAAALERRREQLARKFGGSAAQCAGAGARRGGARTEEEEVTGVDAQGRLVTLGRRKRIFLRCAQASCALLVGVCAIGAAFTKPVETADHPAPKGSAPHWALIVLPFLSLALTIYLFAIHPCLHRRRRASEDPAHGPGAALAGALGVCVQPPQYPQSRRSWFGGGGGGARGGPGPGGKYGAPGGGMSVNLVVDRRLLPGLGGPDDAQRASDAERRERQQKKRRRKRRRRREARRRAATAAGDNAALSSSSSSSSPSTLSSDDSDPWTASRASDAPRDSTSSNPRTALLSHLQHEAAWRTARSFAKRVAAVDFVCCIAWGAVSVWAIGWAGKCAPGDGEGFWRVFSLLSRPTLASEDERSLSHHARSNLFNSAEACAVLASIAFASSFALGCFDLSRAKLSPRLRQQRLAVSA